MTMKECYELVGNYEEAIRRLGGEARIPRYLGKFLQDKSFEKLSLALENKQYKDAFAYAHNLKGVYLNLSLTKAGTAAQLLCEALRDGNPKGDIGALFLDMEKAHNQTICAVSELLGE